MKRVGILIALLLWAAVALAQEAPSGGTTIAGNTCPANQFGNQLTSAGALACTQPASTNLSDIPIPVTSGGTGSTTPSGARTNLSAAASGANSDITALTGLNLGGSSTTGKTVLGECVNVTSTSTTDSSEDVLATCTIPASAMANVGQGVEIHAFFQAAANANTKVASIRAGGLAGTLLQTVTTTTNNNGIAMNISFIKTGSNTQLVDRYSLISSAGPNESMTTTALTDTSSIAIVATGGAGTAGDITLKYLFVKFLN